MSYKEVTTRTDEPNSLEVTRNAKGDYQWSIKVYGNGDLADLIRLVKTTDTRLRKEFLENQESHQQPETKPAIEDPTLRKHSHPLEEEAPKERKTRQSKKDKLAETARKPMRQEEEELEELEEESPPRFRRPRR